MMRGRLFAAVLQLLLGRPLCVMAAEEAASAQRPTADEVRQVVRRLLGKDYDPSRCQVAPGEKSYLIECRQTECHTCQVTHVITTLHLRKGLWAVLGTRREPRGDTGECGCCTLEAG
jgi:hypothetical protein